MAHSQHCICGALTYIPVNEKRRSPEAPAFFVMFIGPSQSAVVAVGLQMVGIVQKAPQRYDDLSGDPENEDEREEFSDKGVDRRNDRSEAGPHQHRDDVEILASSEPDGIQHEQNDAGDRYGVQKAEGEHPFVAPDSDEDHEDQRGNQPDKQDGHDRDEEIVPYGPSPAFFR